MIDIPANPARGLVELVALCFVGLGAGLMFGFGGMCLVLGLTIHCGLVLDEALERVTNKRRV